MVVCDEVPQHGTVDVVGHDIGAIALPVGIVDGQDVGMAHAARLPRLRDDGRLDLVQLFIGDVAREVIRFTEDAFHAPSRRRCLPGHHPPAALGTVTIGLRQSRRGQPRAVRLHT